MNDIPRDPHMLAVLHEHMTDDEIERSRLLSDAALHGFVAIDATTGKRVDPATIRPLPPDPLD